MIYIKSYMTPMGLMVAACDCELLGNKYCDGELRLTVSERFYRGEQVRVEALIPHLRACATANLVGEAVCECALEAGIIDAEGIIRIDGIPHAQLYRM